MHELIAPRPLRLTSAPSFTHHSHSSPASSLIRPKPSVRLVSAPPADAFARITLSENCDNDQPIDRDRPASAHDDADPVAASRDAACSRLSPDALEEFLSILQPVMFNTPASPMLRARYERPHPYKPRTHRRTRSTASASSEDASCTPERTTSRGPSKSANSEERDEVGDEIVFDPRPWPYSSLLASPISRTHTQNPLARTVSHDLEVHTQSAYLIRAAPSPISSPAVLALAQSIPIPASPPSQVSSRGPSPRGMDI
ncbi:hypothetical protein JB92DRAFT_2945549 [Gautieria morchelliformis]|nr:hypothetical protein JB92DRAFT_2945549 [Gautieria morchelliformis]